MALLSIRDLSLSFGAAPLLDGATMHLEPGERVGLVGRNGEGKSTLLKLIVGELTPDQGVVERGKGAVVGMLPQQVPREVSGTVREVITAALQQSETPPEPQAVDKVLSRLGLAADADVAAMSAGMRRRVWLGRALVGDPALLLLDEPTNHLDVETIGWLERLLLREERALLFVTHDRVFLEKVANRIVELDRGVLHDWRCDYRRYLERKDKALEEEGTRNARADKLLAQEEAWLRSGIKARRTRNEGRVRSLARLRAEREARRERMGRVKMTVQKAEGSGKLVIEAKKLSFGFEGAPLVTELSTLVLRGDRIGIMGPNNCGKTTLLRLLLGELAPLQGRLRLGTRLQIAYFDQLRAQLDEHKTVAECVADGADLISLHGSSRHVLGYLGDFLFSPDRARSPVSSLSGGERSRLLLARLLAKPSNVLVLDEPTNDLDVETLELLEERLLDYPGTVLLVSHDRALLNNVVTSTLVFEEPGVVREYAGGYDDWLAQRDGKVPTHEAVTHDDGSGGRTTAAERRRAAKPRTEGPRKLTFKERKELEGLPGQIEALEQEQQTLEASLSDPAFYQREGAEIAQAKERLEAVGQELEKIFERWQELEEIHTAAG